MYRQGHRFRARAFNSCKCTHAHTFLGDVLLRYLASRLLTKRRRGHRIICGVAVRNPFLQQYDVKVYKQLGCLHVRMQ